MATDIIITPGSGQIYFQDSGGTPQQIRLQGEVQNAFYFAGDGTGTGAPSGSTNPSGGTNVSNSLIVFTDSSTGTITPGLSGYDLGSTTYRWNLHATGGDFSGLVTTSTASQLQLGNTGGANGAPLTFSASATAPSSLSAGQMWWDGTALNFRSSSTTWNLLAFPSGTGTSGQIAYWSGTNTLTGNSALQYASNNLGVGVTATPAQRMEIAYGHLKFTPLSAPSSAPTATATGTGILSGTYQYTVAYVTANGVTNLGATVSVTPSSQQVALTSIPVDALGQATARRVYRTIANQPYYYLLTTINDNTTTTYTDNTSDSIVGSGNSYNGQDNNTAGIVYIGTQTAIRIGQNSTGVGAGTLGNLTTGSLNAVFGVSAGSNITTGGANCAFGTNALGSVNSGGYNVGFGYGAGNSLQSGQFNCLFGANAGYNLTASNNTFFGGDSGHGPNGNYSNASISGNNNSFFGYATGQATTTQISNSFAFGTNAVVSGSNQGALGGTGSYATKVGINNSNPSTAQLSIVTDAVGTIGVLINGLTSQTASLEQWAVNGTVLASMSPAGALTSAGIVIQAANQIQFYNSGNTFYSGFQDGGSTANIIYKMPVTAPGSGQVLSSTTPVSGVATLSWTTVSTGGITSIGPSGALQSGSTITLATGNTGTDFNISAATNTITFNIPDASASARGAVTTGSQTWTGLKTLSLGLTVTSAKTTLAAATTGYATLNLPTGTAPTSPVAGDIWFVSPGFNLYNGTATLAITTSSGVATQNAGTALGQATTINFTGAGVTAAYASGTTTVTVPGSLPWTVVTTTTQTIVANNGYVSNNSSLVTFTLPTTAVVGTIIEIAGYGAGGWKIAQNAGQVVQFGTIATTSGTGGSLASQSANDTIRILCVVANTNWITLSSVGSITVV